LTLTAREKEVVDILLEDGPISIDGMIDLLVCSEKRIRNIIGNLKRQGVLIEQDLSSFNDPVYWIKKEEEEIKQKILMWDIETSPIICATFTLQPAYISPDNILQDWFIICASWKWLDEENAETVSILDDKKQFNKDYTNDKVVVKKLHKILNEADVLVAHNGDRFDLKKFNSRAIFHGLDPIPDIPTIDTLKEARKTFNFTSNKLDYICEYLGIGNKIETSKGLWLRCLDGDMDAIKEMINYNKIDVFLLEDLYIKLRPYMKKHPNINLITGNSHACPACGSFNVQKRGKDRTRISTFQRYRCNDCGHWSRDGKTINKTNIR
jgi:predicted RNA-binding Zn-ribbon protein involved in translation (DUF1610 family)